MCNLKFGYCALRNALGGRSDCFVAHVHAVNLDSRRAAVAATKRHRGKSRFRRVEVTTILNLHAGFKLSEVQEVPAVNRQIFNLLLCYNALHFSLLGIYEHSPRRHFHNRICRSKFQLDIASRHASDLDSDHHCDGFESMRRNTHGVRAGVNAPEL